MQTRHVQLSDDASGGVDYLEVNGTNLVRRQNRTIAVVLVACALGIVCVILLAKALAGVDEIRSGVSAARSDAARIMPLLQSILTDSRTSLSKSGVASSDVDSLRGLYSCPDDDAIATKLWIVLGSAFSRGEGVRQDQQRWFNRLKAIYEGNSSKASGRTILSPEGSTFEQQIASLENDTAFQSHLSHLKPLTVFVEHGFVETIAASLSAGVDARSKRPDQIFATSLSLVSKPWMRSNSKNRIVFVLPPMPHAHGSPFLPSACHACTDPLAFSAFNEPKSIAVAEIVAKTNERLAALHAMAALTPIPTGSGNYSPRVNIIWTQPIFSEFSWMRRSLDNSSDANVALSGDCLALNAKGQNLAATYLEACLSGRESDFQLPTVLPSGEED